MLCPTPHAAMVTTRHRFRLQPRLEANESCLCYHSHLRPPRLVSLQRRLRQHPYRVPCVSLGESGKWRAHFQESSGFNHDNQGRSCQLQQHLFVVIGTTEWCLGEIVHPDTISARSSCTTPVLFQAHTTTIAWSPRTNDAGSQGSAVYGVPNPRASPPSLRRPNRTITAALLQSTLLQHAFYLAACKPRTLSAFPPQVRHLEATAEAPELAYGSLTEPG